MAERSPMQWARLGILLLLSGSLAGWALGPLLSLAQEDVLLVESTGLTVDNEHGFLAYWRDHDGERLLGAPVTEPLNEQGRVVQYFERGRLEAHPDLPDSPVLLGRVGDEYAAALWKDFAPPPPRMAAAHEQVFSQTGHTLRAPFLTFWNEHGALQTFGYPISEPLWEYVGDQIVQVQYFERARLEHHPRLSGTPDEIQISSLGLDLALLQGYTVAQPAAPAAEHVAAASNPSASEAGVSSGTADAASAAPDEALPVAEVNAPGVVNSTAAETVSPDAFADSFVLPPFDESPPAEEADWIVATTLPISTNKAVVVNLSKQWLYAYDNDVLVFDAPISTGRDGFETPTGMFAIYAKTPVQTMAGTLNGESYEVPNVTNAMYIFEDVAMHGTYWHNEFGTGVRRSHGCINLPLRSAAWLYNWAPVGTPVRVTW